MKKGSLSHLAVPGAEFAVRVTPRAARDAVETDGEGLRIHVTAPPEDGKANKAVAALLARALGVAKTRLELTHGAASRDKRFRLT
jgi:uncharacterized protein YggU (UPF0235/DUF167 family)